MDIYSEEIDTKTISVPLVNDKNKSIGYDDIIKNKNTLWVHIKVNRTCYYVYDKHIHETYVTKGSKKGPRYKVSSLELISTVGNSNSNSESCQNCSSKSKLIEEYNLLCRKSCAKAKLGKFQTRNACIY